MNSHKFLFHHCLAHLCQSSVMALTSSRNDPGSLSLQDSVYLIFQEQRTSSLLIDEIRNALKHRFTMNNVDERDIRRLRFLYYSRCEDSPIRFQIYIKPDDICPNGSNCKKHRVDPSSCDRLHVVIRDHICCRPLHPQTMWCEDTDCRLVHLPPFKIRDRILSVILYIYARRCREDDDLWLKNMVISDDELVGCYFELFDDSPIPNMTRLQWKRMVNRYSKYQIDHYPQRRLIDNGLRAPFWSIWRIEFVSKNTGNKRWNVIMLKTYHFIIRRVCRHWIEPNRECRNRPSFLCPLFHLDPKCVALRGQCELCCIGPSRNCNRWHFDDSDRRKVRIQCLTQSECI